MLEELQQEQWRVERVSAAKEQTIALQEQRLAALQAELRQAREAQADVGACTDEQPTRFFLLKSLYAR